MKFTINITVVKHTRFYKFYSVNGQFEVIEDTVLMKTGLSKSKV